MHRPPTRSTQSPTTQWSDRALLPRRVYRPRALSRVLAALPLLFVFDEHGAPPAACAWLAFTCVLWPQLARWWAVAGHACQRELGNLLLDPVSVGS